MKGKCVMYKQNIENRIYKSNQERWYNSPGHVSQNTGRHERAQNRMPENKIYSQLFQMLWLVIGNRE